MNEEVFAAKQEIYSYPAQFDFFKNNSLQSACYQLTCCIEEFLIESLSPQNMLQFRQTAIMQDRLRGGYRNAIKWAFQYCRLSEKRFVPSSCPYDFKGSFFVIEQGMGFSNIRNAFDQVELGRRLVSVQGRHVRFSLAPATRDANAELYARFVDHEKPDRTENRTMMAYEKAAFAHMVEPRKSGRWNDFSKCPSDKKAFAEVYRDCLGKVKGDAEEYSNLDFGDFTLEEFEKVYAVLMALGVMNFNYQYQAAFIKRTVKEHIQRPIVFGEITSLVQFVVEYTGVKRKAIKSIIQLLTYDYEFQKNKVTLLQPLFLFGDFLFYSPALLYFSDAVDKLLYVVKAKKSALAVISRIAKEREVLMTERLISFITEHSDLRCFPNYKLIIDGRILAEFDIVVYDSNSNRLLLTELKYFFKADGEKDHESADHKIGNSIKSRAEKQKLAQKYINKLLKDILGEDTPADIPEVTSCVVSQNYSGSSFLEDLIAVFDEFLFKHVLEQCGFNLNIFVSVIEDGSYIPDMRNYLEYQDCTEEYAGYKITYPGMAIRIY